MIYHGKNGYLALIFQFFPQKKNLRSQITCFLNFVVNTLVLKFDIGEVEFCLEFDINNVEFCVFFHLDFFLKKFVQNLTLGILNFA